MTQANQVLATIANPVNDWESLIEEDSKKNQVNIDLKPAAKGKKKKLVLLNVQKEVERSLTQKIRFGSIYRKLVVSDC